MTVSLGRVFGVRLFVEPSWLIILGLVAVSLGTAYFPREFPRWSAAQSWAVAVAAALLFSLSLLLHELAHALVAQRLGVPVQRITLFLFGGAAHISHDAPSPAAELLIAGAGPAASLALGALLGAVALLGDGTDWLGGLALWLAAINVTLGLFNLLPGFPLDGGRALRAALWEVGGDLAWGTRIATSAGEAVGLVLLLTAVFMALLARGAALSAAWLGLVGWFLLGAARASYRAFRVTAALGQLRVRDLMRPPPAGVPASLTLTAFGENHLFQSGPSLFAVTEGEEMVGLAGLPEVRRVPVARWQTTSVGEVMERIEAQRSVPVEASADLALRLMAELGAERLPVLDAGRLVGLVHQSDLLRAAERRARSEG